MKRIAGNAARALAGSGLLRVIERFDRDPDRLRVLAYHRVDDPEADPDLTPGLVSASPDGFAEQVDVLARRCHPIGLEDLLAAHRGERRLPRRAALVTFDDGYRDFAEIAWPILRAKGVPAVLFVPTAFPDTPGPGFWWDRLHAALRRTDRREWTDDALGRLDLADAPRRAAAYKTIRNRVKTLPHDAAMRWLDDLIGALGDVPSVHRVLGWDALRKLAGEGVAVCSHSHAHALCPRLEPAPLAEDLALSKSIVERELGTAASDAVFAYPSAAEDARSREAVRDAGYALAFGGRRNVEHLPLADPMNIDRLPILQYAPALVRAQLIPSVARLGRRLIDERPAGAR